MLETLLAAATVLAATFATTPVAQADPDPDFTVEGVTLDRTSVAVSGLNTVPVGVTLKAKWTSKWAEPNDQMTVYLKRTAGTEQLTYLIATELKLVAGTVKDGTWKGTVPVPSTAHGIFKVVSAETGVYDWGASGDMTDPTPVPNGPSLTVTGVHRPRLTAQVVPRVVPFGAPYKVRVAVIDQQTGKPYASRIPVGMDVDNFCVEYFSAPKYRTNAAGVAEISQPAASANWLNCVKLRNGYFDTAARSFWVLRPGVVTAKPARTVVPVSTVVAVNGAVADKPAGCKVALQRLYGTSQWRGVSLGKTDASGRFRVSAQPPSRGVHKYRVSLPTCGRYQAGVSAAFAITAR